MGNMSASQVTLGHARGRRPGRFDLDGPCGVLAPTSGDVAERCTARLTGRHPLLGATAVAVAGYLALLGLLVGLGALLTGVLLDGPLGRWDVDVVDWMARNRNPALDAVTMVGSHLADTVTVIVVATVVGAYLLARRWAQGTLLLAVGLAVEVSVFLSTTLLVPRDRPPVPKIDEVPPTASYPSGHTAAAMVLFVCLGLICRARFRHAVLCRVLWTMALVVPLLVATSRMYRGMHHPTDVLAGILLGLGAIAVAVTAVRVALLLAGRDARARADGSESRRAGSPAGRGAP